MTSTKHRHLGKRVAFVIGFFCFCVFLNQANALQLTETENEFTFDTGFLGPVLPGEDVGAPGTNNFQFAAFTIFNGGVGDVRAGLFVPLNTNLVNFVVSVNDGSGTFNFLREFNVDPLSVSFGAIDDVFEIDPANGENLFGISASFTGLTVFTPSGGGQPVFNVDNIRVTGSLPSSNVPDGGSTLIFLSLALLVIGGASKLRFAKPLLLFGRN